jgi:hypothetical protein
LGLVDNLWFFGASWAREAELWGPECLFDADACVKRAKEAGKSLIFAWCAGLKSAV